MAQFTFVPDNDKQASSYSLSIASPKITDNRFDLTGIISPKEKYELEALNKYLVQTNAIYENKIKDKEDKKLNNRQLVLKRLHENIGNIETIRVDSSSNFRKSTAIGYQGRLGPTINNNTFGNNTSGLIDLGGRISNTRIKIATKAKYKLEEVNEEGKPKKYELTRIKRDRFMYFDFLSRGVLSLDSLQTTMTEYIKSLDGAPMSTRVNFQWRIKNPYKVRNTIQENEAKSYLQLYLDSRVIPVMNQTQIDKIGASFHLIPTYIATFPSGQLSSDKEEDSFVIQASANLAFLTNNLKDAIIVDAASYDSNWYASFELRIGNFSQKDPLRNWSVFANYSFHETVGSNFNVGFSIAPRGEEKEEENK